MRKELSTQRLLGKLSEREIVTCWKEKTCEFFFFFHLLKILIGEKMFLFSFLERNQTLWLFEISRDILDLVWNKRRYFLLQQRWNSRHHRHSSPSRDHPHLGLVLNLQNDISKSKSFPWSKEYVTVSTHISPIMRESLCCLHYEPLQVQTACNAFLGVNIRILPFSCEVECLLAFHSVIFGRLSWLISQKAN